MVLVYASTSESEETSFVCTDVIINGSTYYLTLKKLDGYDWSMLFLVPSDEVAASTRAMTASMIHIFIITLVVLMVLCLLSFLFVSRFRKNQELLAVKTRSEAALSAANKKLEDAITLLRKSSFDVILMPCKTPSEDIQKSKEADMDEHLSKPVDISALEQAVRRFHVTPPQK